MVDINDEMRITAEYAISTARERYGLSLDYSEESLGVLDNILEKIYWGFSSHAKDEGEGGLIYNAAIIWGSYLGEYMRLKWGGTWILKDTERCISITSIEFSPISFVFQRITNHPEYSVRNFVLETKKVIYTSVIHPQKAQSIPESAGQVKKSKPQKPARRPLVIDKRVIYTTGGVLGVLVVIIACLTGYTLVKSGGLPAFSFLVKSTSTYTATIQPTVMATVTPSPTETPYLTATPLPTYTSRPTNTPRPTRTPTVTLTPTASLTPTETPWPTDTEIPYRSPTPTKRPTETERPADTQPPPPPTNPPVIPEILGCNANLGAGDPPSLNISVQFSVPGYGIDGVSFIDQWPGQSGCNDPNADGDATASCTGSAGYVPSGQSVSIDIQTPLGSCSSGYSGQ